MGDHQGEKKSKNCCGIHCHAMTVFWQELEGLWKIFLFLPQVWTSEWPFQLRPRSVLPTVLCPTMTTKRCPGKRKKSARARGTSLACFPASSCFRQHGLFSNPQQVSLAGILCGTCGNIRGVTTARFVYEELPCGSPELCALGLILSCFAAFLANEEYMHM